MKSFPFPLPASALSDFVHPAEWHMLHHARRYGDEVLAGNGYVALRAVKGMWLPGDHAPASAEFLSRFGKLPWGRWDDLEDDWRALDSQRGRIFERAAHSVWLDEKVAPSPVWMVNEVRVRLSLLQLVARLPRAEVYTGRTDRQDPLFVRFSGGKALIAADPRLTLHSCELFPGARDIWSGERIRTRRTTFRGAAFGGEMANWPPPDSSES